MFMFLSSNMGLIWKSWYVLLGFQGILRKNEKLNISSMKNVFRVMTLVDFKGNANLKSNILVII